MKTGIALIAVLASRWRPYFPPLPAGVSPGQSNLMEKIDTVRGQIFNIGGGPENALSLLELLDYLARKLGRNIPTSFAGWRPGDQPCYISDITKVRAALGWEPTVPKEEGLERLFPWVAEHLDEFRRLEILQAPVRERVVAK